MGFFIKWHWEMGSEPNPPPPPLPFRTLSELNISQPKSQNPKQTGMSFYILMQPKSS